MEGNQSSGEDTSSARKPLHISSPSSEQFQSQDWNVFQPQPQPETQDANQIVRSIASYLSLSDVESLGSLSRYSIMSPMNSSQVKSPKLRKKMGSHLTLASIDDTCEEDFYEHSIEKQHCYYPKRHNYGPDAAAGFGLDTPRLVMSPLASDEEYEDGDDDDDLLLSRDVSYGYGRHDSEDSLHSQLLIEKTRQHLKHVQKHLKDAVFCHPTSIRSYCLTSYKAAKELKEQRLKENCILCPKCYMIQGGTEQMCQATYLDKCTCESQDWQEYKHKSSSRTSVHERLFQFLTSSIFQNIPLSIILDIANQTKGTSVQLGKASFQLTVTSTGSLVDFLVIIIHDAIDVISYNLNPWNMMKTIFSFQREAMEKTGEAIVTGIQSVATGVGSVSQSGFGGIMKNNHSPKQNLYSAVGQILRKGGVPLSKGGGKVISDKMHQRLNKVNPSTKVVTYIERDDEDIPQHAKKRVLRMMHYSVPLRPFVATVELGREQGFFQDDSIRSYLDITNHGENQQSLIPHPSSMCEAEDDEDYSPFMCTPQSFPHTPASRAHVLARGTRFAEDVVFLARDQLRVESGLDSKNEQTRAMAMALREGKRLAVFNASDMSNGISLSCGQHSASKTGNDLYSSVRGMIPVLRNSFVYFEMTVSTPPLLSMVLQHASLSIGLSTLEMPLNALVGAWKGSISLCSTGQILAGSQWCSPLNPKTYASNSTVGCLVYLDDDNTFDTWDGLMVTANAIFNVDGHVIIPGSFPTQQDQEENESSDQLSPVVPFLVPCEEELFPTLTLHSSQTEVLCRFCAEDIIATSRKSIGAPHGVTVYCCDGSVLFEEGQSSEWLDSNEDDVSFSDDSLTESESIQITGNNIIENFVSEIELDTPMNNMSEETPIDF